MIICAEPSDCNQIWVTTSASVMKVENIASG